MTIPPQGGLHSLKPPERLPKLHICARSREIQTGGQNPLNSVVEGFRTRLISGSPAEVTGMSVAGGTADVLAMWS